MPLISYLCFAFIAGLLAGAVIGRCEMLHNLGMTWADFRKRTKPESPVDRGNALLKAQQEMREADPRPSEEIVRDMRETEWK